MENQQSETLNTASEIELAITCGFIGSSAQYQHLLLSAVSQLHRLHARVEELEEAMLDAVGAGGVSAQRVTQGKDHFAQPRKMVAAPVALPEPVAAQIRHIKEERLRTIALVLYDLFAGDEYERRYIYTEQQVRDLLAEAACTKSQTTTQEPFGYFKAEPFGWRDCAETDEGAIALYEAPQPQADARDAERLDWLIEQGCSNGVVYEFDKSFWIAWLDGHDAHKDKHQIGRYNTAREAIDAAIAAA